MTITAANLGCGVSYIHDHLRANIIEILSNYRDSVSAPTPHAAQLTYTHEQGFRLAQGLLEASADGWLSRY